MVGPDGLRVEPIVLDRGSGPIQTLRVTRGAALLGYARSVPELQALGRQWGFDPADLVEEEP